MKRKITLSIALVLSIVLVSLMSSDSTAQAQPGATFINESGAVWLEPNHVLRLTVVPGAGDDTINVRLRVMHYPQCNGGASAICKTEVASQNTSPPIMLLPGETAWATFPSSISGGAVRANVLTTSRKTVVTFQIIDTTDGKIVSTWTDDNGAPAQLGLN